MVMPNLSPENVRKNMLYNNKRSDGAEAAQNIADGEPFNAIGYKIDFSRGIFKKGEDINVYL